MLTITDALTHTSAMRYDLLDRLLAVTTTQSAVNKLLQRYTYDIVGNLTSVTQWPEFDLTNYATNLAGSGALGGGGNRSGVTSFVGGSGRPPYLGGGAVLTATAPAVWDTRSYTYGDTRHVHAVTALSNGALYTYDSNGNMTRRMEGGHIYTQTYDAENRLVSVLTQGPTTTQYLYNGDGALIKIIHQDGTATLLIGPMEYELTTGGAVTTTKSTYGVPGAQVIREASGLSYVLGDHLSSASVTLDSSGSPVGELRYYAYGGTRVSTGTTPTDRRYTGQRQQADIGLYYYNARWYDPYLNRWAQPDTIIPSPGNPQDLNRYAYARGNPLKYIDPSGHAVACPDCGGSTKKDGIIGQIWLRNRQLVNSVRGGNITDLEALAQLTDYAASFYPDCSSCLVRNLGSVLTGHSNDGYLMSEVSARAGMAEEDLAYRTSAAFRLLQSGYDPIFQDPRTGPGFGGEQAHHLWYYVQVGHQDGEFLGDTSVFLHETLIGQRGGMSYQDLALGGVGVDLGRGLENGTIQPSEAGDYIRNALSPDSAESERWREKYRAWGWTIFPKDVPWVNDIEGLP